MRYEDSSHGSIMGEVNLTVAERECLSKEVIPEMRRKL